MANAPGPTVPNAIANSAASTQKILCYIPHGNDNPLSSAFWASGSCPPGSKPIPGNPGPSDLPIIGGAIDATKSLATSVSDFFKLITNTAVLKGVWLVIVGGVLLLIGVRFLKS